MCKRLNTPIPLQRSGLANESSLIFRWAPSKSSAGGAAQLWSHGSSSNKAANSLLSRSISLYRSPSAACRTP